MASITGFSFFFRASMIFLSQLVIMNSCVGDNVHGPPFETENREENEGILPTTTITGVQGLVYCNSSPQQIPLQGALVRIRCVAVHEDGYETAPFSVLSDATDDEGYFFATFSASEVEDDWTLTHCKAFLESSPTETCRFPTDIKNGVAGSPLLRCRYLTDDNINLCSVEPLFFASYRHPHI